MVVATRWQVEGPTNRIELFQLAALWFGRRLILGRAGIDLRIMAFRFLVCRLSNYDRGALVPMSTDNTRCVGCLWRSKSRFCDHLIDLPKFDSLRRARHVSNSRLLRVRKSFRGRFFSGGTIDLCTNDAGCIGRIKVTERKPK